MRYAGGGVGHYRVTLPDTPANANEIQEDFAVEDNVMADPQRLTNLELEERGTVPEAAGLEEVEEHIQDDNIEDHCSDSEVEEDSDDEEHSDSDEDDFGAEDGEGRFLDAEDDEGYAAL